MATSFWFNGKKITEPGAYSMIKSGIKNPPRDLDYGNILIIDTGVDADISQNFGSGPGINGTLNDGPTPVQEFDNMLDFRNAIGGGMMWAAAEFLFRPKGVGTPGISKLYYVRAATTVPAELTFTPTGGGSAGGNIVLQCRNEGSVGNGVKEVTELVLGYAFKMRAGSTSGKYVLDFYRGTYRGNNGSSGDGIAWDGIERVASKPDLFISTPEFDNLNDIEDWMKNDSTFQSYFKVKTYTKTGTGAIDSSDATSYANYTLASSGTTTYNASDLTAVLDTITEIDYTFILSDIYGSAAYQDSTLSSILYHLTTDARYDKYLILGGGEDKTEFDQATDSSFAIAEDLDTSKVVVVHGDFYKNIRITTARTSYTISKRYESFFKAANVLGRILGKEPQVPGTSKSLSIDGEVHILTQKERIKALDAGVLVSHYDSILDDFVILQSINSLQDNAYLIKPDGQSHEISIERIKAQLNKELVVNAKKDLLGQENGVNRNTLSEQDIKLWTENYLKRKIANQTDDNLILGFRNVTVDTIEDAYQVNYEFAPNGPINKLLFVGTMVNF